MIIYDHYAFSKKNFMDIQILKSKLHRATVTDTLLDYEGSCAIDSAILEISEINEYEMIHIYNINNGERFTTYAIKAEPGSGIITLNGAAAHKGSKNDLIIICTYAFVEKNKISEHKPKLIYFKNNSNLVDKVKSSIPTQKNKIVNL